MRLAFLFARKNPARRRGLSRLLTQYIAYRVKLTVEVVLSGCNLVLDFREAGVEARLGSVHALLKSLETASDCDGYIICTFVDDALDEFEVLLI
jgi:hypothetical protein